MTDTRSRLQAALGNAYTLSGEIGGAGMSRVFAAEEVALQRTVVIKVLPPDLASLVNVERFRREIQLGARLQQPFIVPVLTAGEADGLLYYSMPKVEGESLQSRLARERQLPVGDTVRILRDVLGALAYAHAHGVVHRDIKPANVLLSGEHALVTDFGIAKALGTAAEGKSLTATGIAIGTPAYMAPEQAVGESAIDHRADLYAVGVLAYEMLAGQAPFSGANLQQVMARQLTQDADLVTVFRPNVPPQLAALVRRLMEKNPADRPQSADEVLRALDDIGTLPHTPSRGLIAARRARPSAGWRARSLLALALVLVLTPATAVVILRNRGRDQGPVRASSAPADEIRSVAVLPMENASSDSENAFFADGLTDDLIDGLSKLQGIKTISRNSVFALKGKQLTTRAIGDTLGVDALLSGSVRRRAGGLKIVLQLVNVANDSTVWSASYEGGILESATMQDSIVRAIVNTLKVRITERNAAPVSPGTTNSEAYELFLRGRTLVNARTGFETAILYFTEALQKDSAFAPAYAGLATAYLMIANNVRGNEDKWPLARKAVTKAIALDDELGEAHAAMAMILMTHDRAWDAAAREFAKAIKQRPGYADAHQWYALYLAFRGRRDEAKREVQRARELDPLSASIINNSMRILTLLGRSDAVLRELRKTRALVPEGNRTYAGLYLEQAGDLPGALAEHERAVNETRRDPEVLAYYARTLAIAGRRGDARAILQELAQSSSTAVRPISVAAVHLALGDKNKALDWLEKAVAEERDLWILELGVNPFWDPLRAEPRLTALLRELGLA